MYKLSCALQVMSAQRKLHGIWTHIIMKPGIHLWNTKHFEGTPRRNNTGTTWHITWSELVGLITLLHYTMYTRIWRCVYTIGALIQRGVNPHKNCSSLPPASPGAAAIAEMQLLRKVLVMTFGRPPQVGLCKPRRKTADATDRGTSCSVSECILVCNANYYS